MFVRLAFRRRRLYGSRFTHHRVRFRGVGKRRVVVNDFVAKCLCLASRLQSVVLLFEETKRGGESSECAYQESCKFLIIERHNALLDVRVRVKGIRGN